MNWLRNNFTVPTREELERKQAKDTELKLLREWIEQKQCLSANNLVPLIARILSLAQLFDQILLHESVLVVNRLYDHERVMIDVVSTFTECVIRFFHEGLGGAHQAPKDISAKIIRFF